MAEALATFADGLAAEDNADTDRALEAFRRTLELDPSNTELAVKVAFELARRGEVAEGISLLKDAAKALPKDPLPPLCLSQLYGKFLRKPDLAERYGLSALALAPENFSPYLALYDLYSTEGDNKKAAAVLERAARANSTDPYFWLQLGDLEARVAMRGKNLPASALKKLNALFEKALSYAGEDEEALSQVADYYTLTRQLEKAVPLYEKAISASGAPASEPIIAIRSKLADAYLTLGRREDAIRLLQGLVKDAPTRYETYEKLGEIHALAGELPQAIANYQQALLIDSTQPRHYLRIARLQLLARKPKEAVKTLTEAATRFPGLPLISAQLGASLTEAGEPKKALHYFEQALREADTSSEPVLDSAFYFQYGAAAERSGNLEKAAEMLRKSIELDPSNAANAYNYLGYMWADYGIHLPEAMELIKRALELDPENAAYLDSLGWVYYRMGDFPQALLYLQRSAERLQPEDPVVMDHLGDAHHALGNQEAALDYWKKALALDPENKALSEKIAAGKPKNQPTPAPAPPTAPPPPEAPPAP